MCYPAPVLGEPMPGTRRLAAIMAIDVVGYSRLMGDDESGTVRAVREHREAARPIVAGLGGRIVKTMGDGLLLEFPSVIAAVQCTIAIQKLMAERNANVADGKRIVYRIGVNLGDVLIEGEDVLGDGVNIAARLEGICEPGGVLISGTAYDHVRGKIDADFVDLGEKALKNIARPVRLYSLSPVAVAASADRSPAASPVNSAALGRKRWVYALAACAFVALAAGWFGWRSWPHAPAASAAPDLLASAPRLSLVVLPFENLSGDPDQNYFADGITDDLTTDLSHLPDSFVIARNTAFTYKGKPIDVKQLGRELGVRYALEGSVRRVDENITLNAQLISTETGAHVWADRFDGQRAKLGQLQVEFVARLASSLDLELVRAESLRAMRERPANPNAVDLAMRGWATSYNGYGIDNVNKALDDFERALQLDPSLVRAQVGAASMLTNRVSIFRAGDVTDLDRADTLITSALSAEPNDAQAHYVKANLLFARKQFAGALSELRDVIEINRNSALAYGFYGVTLIFVGKAAETIPNVEIALRLSPRDPIRNLWEASICHAHMHLAEWEQAVEWCEKSIATNANYWIPHVDLVSANGWLHRDADARQAIDGLLKLKPGFTVQSWANMKWSDDPTFQREYQSIVEGLRMAGLPEK